MFLHFRLNLELSSRHVSSYVHHRNGTKVVEASTKEFCIARHLYKTSDVAAAYNVGRVIAERCKETGLYRVVWQHVWKQKNNKKVNRLLMVMNVSTSFQVCVDLCSFYASGEGISQGSNTKRHKTE